MTAGRVSVNGVVVTELGSRVDPRVDVVTVDGVAVHLADGPVYLVLSKPAGYLTTMADPRGRPTVAELLPDDAPGLFPVGRLDKDTTGVLLVTTDGEIAHRLMHPSYHVPKTYRATVEGSPAGADLERLRTGIELDDGPTKPAKVRRIGGHGSGTKIEITISEGRKRQVKRMFAAIGHPVVSLHREAFGPVVLDGQEEGTTRPLSAEEVTALRRAAGLDAAGHMLDATKRTD